MSDQEHQDNKAYGTIFEPSTLVRTQRRGILWAALKHCGLKRIFSELWFWGRVQYWTVHRIIGIIWIGDTMWFRILCLMELMRAKLRKLHNSQYENYPIPLRYVVEDHNIITSICIGSVPCFFPLKQILVIFRARNRLTWQFSTNALTFFGTPAGFCCSSLCTTLSSTAPLLESPYQPQTLISFVYSPPTG